MALLFLGMPVVAVLMYLLSPDLGGMQLGAFTSLIISSMAGLLASTTLAVSIINERTQGVFDLYLVRPVKRSHLVLAKYIAVVVCVIAAAAVALLIAGAYDYAAHGTFDLGSMGQPMMIVITMTSLSCAVAVLVGTMVRSVLLGVILTLYGGNQLSAVVVLTSLQSVLSIEASTLIGVALAMAVLAGATSLFVKRVSC
jgi:ABC-2 type transport system permease protein